MPTPVTLGPAREIDHTRLPLRWPALGPPLGPSHLLERRLPSACVFAVVSTHPAREDDSCDEAEVGGDGVAHGVRVSHGSRVGGVRFGYRGERAGSAGVAGSVWRCGCFSGTGLPR